MGWIFIFLLLAPSSLHASHIAGADITYRWISGNSYEVTATLYRDCSGVMAPYSIPLNYYSVSCNYDLTATLSPVPGTGQEITHACSSQVTRCTGGTYPGIQKWEYRATITLPAQCTDWHFGFFVCCRNCAITTLQYPGSLCANVPRMYVEATLNNVVAPTNTSPVFNNLPVAFLCIGQTYNYNHGATDANGDSVVYSWITPHDQSATTFVNFAPGYSATNPISSSPPASLNTSNGTITVRPTAVEVGVMAILVREYRNGVLVGSVIRDMQFWTQPCNNILPTVSGINGGSNLTLRVCAGQPINFSIHSGDLDPGQVVTMSWNNGIPGATFASAGSPYPVGQFSWTPTVAHARPQPYTFTVTVYDNNCPSNGLQTATYSIYVSSVSATVAATNSLCSTPGTGTVTAYPAQGTGPYTYAWSPGGGSAATRTNLNPGTYIVTVTDANGCTTTASATVTAPTPVVPNLVSSTPVNCNGGNSGSATISASGGTSPYTYSWSPSGGTGASATNLSAGNYVATVTDAHGCQQTLPVTITQPLPLSASSVQTNVMCNGSVTGSATITPSGGTSPYRYDWLPNGASTATVNGLAAGNYSVIVTDARGCTQLRSITITQPSPLVTNVSGTSATCGLSNGTVSVSASGGTGPYSYLWSPGNATTSSVSGVAAGAYSVRVTDANGCIVTNAVGISNAGGPTAAVATLNPVACYGGSTGSASVVVTGGSAPFTYQWQPSGGAAASASNLAAGSYTVTIRDVNNCVSSVSINIPQPPVLQLNLTASDPVCFGGYTGSASVSVSGGNGPYSYSWMPGGNATSTVSGLGTGNYTVTVTDANGCIHSSSTSLSQPAALNASVSANTSVSCQGGNNGAAAIAASGGTLPYSYSWSPTGGTLANATGLSAGAYTVTVTDGNNCTRTVPVSVSQPPALNAAINSTNVLCSGNASGTASVIANGGTAPYSYQWSPSGGTSPAATGLGAGNYSVLITDAHSCAVSATTVIAQPSPLNLTIQAPVNVSCFGGADGSATVAVAGGTGPYTYQWSPAGGNASSATGLAAGSYTVTVTDAHNCFQSALVFVNQPTQLTRSMTNVSPVLCYGGNTGAAQVTAAGGVAPYSYSWTGGAGTSDLANSLAAGSYSVTIQDANGCVTSSSVTITQPPLLQVNVSSNNATCGSANGSVASVATGGAGGYTYQWSSPGGTGTGMSNLPAGSYTVTVTDANGCLQSAIAGVSNTGGPTAMANKVSNVSCAGGSNGSASVNISAGTPPFAIAWSPSGGNSTVANNLSAGNYSVTITDANGCVSSSNVNIAEPTPLALATSSTNVLCNGTANGTASAVVTGGTANYTYSWTPGGAASASVGNLGPGTYTVNVLDALGCSANASVTISQPTALSASTASTPVSCNGDNNGTAALYATGGTPGYSYAWTPAVSTGSTAFTLTAGSYSVTVTDANGCSVSRSIPVSQPAVLDATTNGTPALCNGASNGSANVLASGGTSPYAYAWSPSGGTSNNATGLAAGAYAVTVTDSRGCSVSSSYTVTQPALLVSTLASLTPVSCFNGSNGSSTVQSAGGTGPYSYSWSPSGGSGPTAAGLVAGNYSVTITDRNGCQDLVPVVILQPPLLQSVISSFSDVSCHGGNNGSASVNTTGGTPGYTVSWSPSGGTNDIASNMTAGNYSVTVTDANGCVTTVPVTIAEPPPLVVQVSSQPALCGASNGSAAVVVTGGTFPYSYLWSPYGGNAASAGGLSAGPYSVIVIDSNGCQQSLPTSISNMGGPAVNVNALHQVSCFGGNNGSAVAQVLGGTGPFTYQWLPSGATTATAASLPAGNHSVIITDVNGCVTTGDVQVAQPPPLAAVANAEPASCFGSANGNVAVHVSGGTAPYQYAWTGSTSTSSTATNLAAGNYTVTVTDGQGCLQAVSAVVDQPPLLNLTTSSVAALCYGSGNGSAQVVATGGVPGYTYAWSPSGGSSASAQNLAAGNYSVQVTDAQGCQSSHTVVVAQPSAVVLQTSAQSSFCGSANGSASVVANGGTLPYAYEWIPSGGNQPSATGLPAANYSVIVTDAHGCNGNASVRVNNVAGPDLATVVTTPISCFGGSNGSGTVNVTNGTAPFQYAWLPGGNNTAHITQLSAGNYSVTVTDAHGCMATENLSLSEPPVLAATTSSSDALCFGSSDGSARVTAGGGTAPYQYQWNSAGITTPLAGNLAAGMYSVTITDANGCSLVASATVNQPAALGLLMHAAPARCFGEASGSAGVAVTGGTTGYSYAWLPAGGNSSNANNLPAGNYSVTVTDAHGCLETESVIVSEPDDLASVMTATPALCHNSSDGTASAAITGGTGPYAYAWAPAGGTGNTAYNLPAGNYGVLVTDAQGCILNSGIAVTAPEAIDLLSSSVPALCHGSMDGSASVSATGGTAPFSYSWSPSGGTNALASNLAAGTYSVRVTDNNGCTKSTSAVVGQPAPVVLNANGDATICIGQSTLVTSGASGGTAPYSFLWSNGANTPSQQVNPVSTTNYTVLVTDSHGCSAAQQSVLVTVNPPLAVHATGSPPFCAGESGILSATASGGNGVYTYVWDNGTHGAGLTVRPAVTTTYTVTVTDGCGTPPAQDLVALTVHPLPVVTFTPPVMHGCAPLEVQFHDETNALPGASYLWHFGDNTTHTAQHPSHTYPNAGTYSVSLEVITPEGCRGNLLIPHLVSVYPNPVASFIQSEHEITILDKEVRFTNTGYGATLYDWDFGDGTSSALENPSHRYLDTGMYTITQVVSTDFGCRDITVGWLKVSEGFTIYIPNAFTPNNDGNNDGFIAVGTGWTSYDMWILDRWGVKIFHSTSPDQPWDGSHFGNNEQCQIGVYEYVIRVGDDAGRQHSFTGHVTLVK